MQISDIKPGERISGIVGGELIYIICVRPFGQDAVELIYRKNDSSLGQQLLYADDLDDISIEANQLQWQFDVDANQVRLA